MYYAHAFVILSGVNKLRNLKHRKLGVSGGLVVLIAAVLTITWYVSNQTLQPARQATQTVSAETTTTTPEERISRLVLDSRADNSPSAKADTYYSLGVAYLDIGKPSQAIKAFQDAYSADTSYELKSLDGIVNAYNMLSDRPHMITTIRAIITYLNASKDLSLRGQVSWYQYKLQVLLQGGDL